MDLLTLIVIIVMISLVAVGSVLLDRKWQQRATQQRQGVQATASATPTTGVQNISGQNSAVIERIREVWRTRLGRQPQAASESLKIREELTTFCANQPSLQGWMKDLSANEFNMLYQRLQTFCTAQQIDLGWLGEPSLAKDPELQAALQTVIVHYLEAEQQVSHVQNELKAFHLFQMIERRPYSHEVLPFLQQLYAQVVKAGLAAPVRAEALLATEKIRVHEMLLAVQSAAEANRPAFYRIVNTLNQTKPNESNTPPVSAPDSDPQPVTGASAA